MSNLKTLNITQGKWIVNAKDADHFGPRVWVQADSGNYICECVRNTREFDNAKLIAAAPEMFGLLADIRSELGNMEWANPEHAETQLQALIDKYHRVIGALMKQVMQ